MSALRREVRDVAKTGSLVFLMEMRDSQTDRVLARAAGHHVGSPDLVHLVLRDRPGDFPKSERVGEGLRPLLGQSVFVTNGATWARQRRIIDPAFEGGRLKQTFPAMLASAGACAERLRDKTGVPIEIEANKSNLKYLKAKQQKLGHLLENL